MEAKMDPMDTMDDAKEYMHTAFWQEDEVVLAYHSDLPLITGGNDVPISSNKERIIEDLNLRNVNAFLNQKGFNLKPFSEKDTLRSQQLPSSQLQASDDRNDLNSPIGKYLFRAPKGEGTNVICFFRFESVNGGQPTMAGPTSGMMPTEMMSTQTDGQADDYAGKDDKGGNPNMDTKSDVTDVVNLLNQNLKQFVTGDSQPIGATPNWYSGATSLPDGPKPQGCPLTPPIPVPADKYCPDSPGLWPINVPELSRDPKLSREMQSMAGDGVTVFILDTLPKAGEISTAVEGAEKKNLLLLDVANKVTFNRNILSDVLDVPSPLQPGTGKDIYGRIIGFHMPDHGLFAAGIVRDLAPNARVECVRVLNDFTVGSMAMLTKALEDIHTRMLRVDPTGKEGDLHNKPVVINMSLVVGPPDGDILDQGFDPAFIQNVRASLLESIKSLADLGVVFAAATGNEADPRNKVMNPKGLRPGPLYPAAFAYDPDNIQEMIPVGAVNKTGAAASYSNYPGPRGIATYGGEIPTPVRPVPPDCMTGAKDIDALIGIYTSLSYPALSARDCESRYPVPNANAWAYWSGTSFATPIISALAARVLELKQRGGLPADTSVRDTLINSIATRQTQWTRLEPAHGVADGHMILAVQQCPSADNDGAGEDSQYTG